MKYQFQIDGRGFDSPVWTKWEIAAQDAVSAGYATWTNYPKEIKIDTNQGAEIAQIEE